MASLPTAVSLKGCKPERLAPFKFHDHDLSTEQQLVVQKSRTPQGHTQDWASFELPGGTKLNHARLHWRTNVPVTRSAQPQVTKTGPHFFLDLFYYSKDRRYRFAIRVNRAEISSASSYGDGPALLLRLVEAVEWDPPKNVDYELQPERPATWLKLPVTLKLQAKTQGCFEKFAREATSLGRSQNSIRWGEPPCDSYPSPCEPAQPPVLFNESIFKTKPGNIAQQKRPAPSPPISPGPICVLKRQRWDDTPDPKDSVGDVAFGIRDANSHHDSVVAADPTYRFLSAGRNLDEEFRRKLTFSEAIVVQWAEEWDRRRGIARTGPLNLDQVYEYYSCGRDE
ncbi:hypothetical protein DRE_02792 [Drechslerella stenobrocha 248]|uniref:Uncharacterized protein n=1 Tax=Drechslerella stenobrocha 248 TaxID=1043628 RepID=W7IFH6_9PEZI|nr:hypothetical protein DRE_02792 [Drechslerella stenobrocha 248]